MTYFLHPPEGFNQFQRRQIWPAQIGTTWYALSGGIPQAKANVYLALLKPQKILRLIREQQLTTASTQ